MIKWIFNVISGIRSRSRIERYLKNIRRKILSSHKNNISKPLDDSVTKSESDELNKYSSHAKNIYHQLRAAEAAYARKVQ